MIEIKHLKTLYTLAQLGSLSKTSERLCMTQSALSHQLTELEKRLGYRLFIRKSQPINFTKQGHILLALAQRVLPQVQHALTLCHEGQKKQLRIAVECHSCIQWLIPIIHSFKQIQPQVDIYFQSVDIFLSLIALQQAKLDLVITSDNRDDKELIYIPLFDFEVKLIMAPEHPLANKSTISPADLKDETLLIYPVDLMRLDIWRYFLLPASVQPSIRKVDNTMLLLQMTAANMGIAALPHWAVTTFESQRLIVTRSLGNEGLWRTLYIAIRRDDQAQPIINLFIETLLYAKST